MGRTRHHGLPPLVVPDSRRMRVGVRPEVAQRDKRFAAGVVEHHPLAGRVVANEYLVLGQLAVADHRWRLEALLADPAAPLHRDQTIRAIVTNRLLVAGTAHHTLGS